MSTPTRFSDGQYKNWLKCSLSLIIMKEAMHDYTDNEVKQLHGDIKLKVSSIPCASSTGNQCGSCSSKNIRLTGKPGNWSINCKNSICDKWLQQILTVHDDSHNPRINWKNADISIWPIDCYQVAKIFMPKGQDKTVMMPNDLDAPAILSLFKYCNWFRKDLPSTQILSDLIDIRNKLLHSGELRVVDGDKDSWIDLMMQLLSDLNIHVDTQAELEKLKKEDIDINFRENEIRVFQRMTSDLASDITTLKDEMASMQISLSEVLEKVSDSKTETTGKVDALEADMEIIRKSLHELQVIYDKMVSFFDKNSGILEKEITEKIRTIGMDVKDLQNNLTRVETELKARVSLLEKHLEETNMEVKGIKEKMEGVEGTFEETKEKIEGIERRVAAVEKQEKYDERLSLQTETRRNKIPESEGLRQLKAQTENKLDTHRMLGCIPTKQAEKAKKLLAEKISIVIEGNPGEGKTTMSLHLIDNEIFRDKRVVLNKPRQWEKVDTDWVAIVVLEDVFGQYDLDPGRFQEWMIYLPTIQENVDVGKLQVIVTTRVDVLSKAYSRLGSLKLFSKEFSLTLSSEQLTNSEKVSILNRELHRHKRNLKEEEKEVCIANFGGLIGFPQCCSLFAGDSKSFDKGPDFLRSPKKFFVENIEGLEDMRFLSLAFLFCNGELLVENLSSDTMPETSKKLLMELASRLQNLKKIPSIELLRNTYDSFLELYVMKSTSYDFSLNPVVEKPSIMFIHATVSEAVGHVLWKRCCEMVVKYGDSEYLYQRTYTAEVQDSTSENAFLPVYVYGLLAERMVHDVVNRRLVSSVVKHPALQRHDFIKKLKDKLNKGNVLTDFFMAGKDEFQSDNLSEGKCVTFMQYILQGDEDFVRLVYSELLEMLACAHDNILDCWLCEEKQNLLELALYYHHFEIADKLITLKSCYTNVSLCNAARHGDLKRVQNITERLKENQVFNPESLEAKHALYIAYVSGNQSLIDFLLKEGIILDSWCVINAVKHGDMNVLIKVVEHLKCYNKWNPKCDDASKTNVVKLLIQRNLWNRYWKKEWIDITYLALSSRGINLDRSKSLFYSDMLALYSAYCNEQFPIVDYLLEKEVKVEMYMLVYVLKRSSQTASLKVIKDLKDTGTWNPHCDDASEALEMAYSLQKYDVYDLLVQDGVSLKMKNLPGVIMGVQRSSESLEKAIQHMKDTDNWDPMCDDASEALETAICEQLDDVYDLLVQNGVSLKMKNLQSIIMGVDEISLEYFKKVIQHMKDTDNWDPKCDDASEALETAIHRKKYDVYDLLFQDGVSLKMENLLSIIMGVDGISLESVKKVIQHLKETEIWDPKCNDASRALEAAIHRKMYDVYDLLVQDGVSLKMENLISIIMGDDEISFESVVTVIHHLKDTDNWDPKCDDASEVLSFACNQDRYDVVDLLVQEGVLLNEDSSG